MKKKSVALGAIDIAAVQSRMLIMDKLEVTNCDIQCVGRDFLCH